ncbi:MAG: hypothetical protein AAFP00_04555, partial [Bacteroidota bacterium]
MAFALKLFSISFYHTYYQAQVSNDFALVPTEESQRWMQRYSMRLTSTGSGRFEVLWAVAGLAHPLQTLKEKMEDKTLSFYIQLNHPSIMRFSALPMDTGRAYHFHNKGRTAKLHQAAYVSEADQVPASALSSGSHKRVKNFWGRVDIHLDALWQSNELTEDQLPIAYTVKIKAKAVIGRYRIIDKNSRIKNPIKVVLNNKDSYFKKVSKSESPTERVSVYESKQPMA